MTAQHGAPEGQTLGALVHQLSQQIPELIRSEMRLAQAEVAEKGKRAGVGIGMFSVAGLLAFFAVAAFVTTAILGLAHVVDAWLAALVVGLVLLAGAAVVGPGRQEQGRRGHACRARARDPGDQGRHRHREGCPP